MKTSWKFDAVIVRWMLETVVKLDGRAGGSRRPDGGFADSWRFAPCTAYVRECCRSDLRFVMKAVHSSLSFDKSGQIYK
jgi:hypothetical protein